MHTTTPPIYLVSSCLAGLCTRYDGKVQPNLQCLRKLQGSTWIPVCPEQLGGLSTPRDAADIVGGDGYDVLSGSAAVLTRTGQDLTREFIFGARQVLQIAQSQNVVHACLKARSPSCAVSGITGVTAALLVQHGIKVSEY